METSGELKSAGVEKWNKAVFKEKAFTCGRERESPLRNRQEAKTGNMVSRFQTTHNRKDVNLDRFPEFETLKFLLLLTYKVSVTSLTEMERGAVQTPLPSALSQKVPQHLSPCPPAAGVLSRGGRDRRVPGQRGASLARGLGAPAVPCAPLPVPSTGKAGGPAHGRGGEQGVSTGLRMPRFYLPFVS